MDNVKEMIKEENNKKAAEFVRRLEDGNFPECDVEINYCSSFKSGAKTEASKKQEEVRKMEELKAKINKEIEATYTRLKDGCKTYGELLDKIGSIKKDAQFSGVNSLETSICNELLFMAMEEMKMIPTAKVYFYCDGRDEKCNGSDHCYANSPDGDGCRHTTNINHARNFRRRRNNNFWEGMKCDDELSTKKKNETRGTTASKDRSYRSYL